MAIEWEDAVIEGIEARQQRDGAQWKLGDLACALETAYAGHTLAKYAEDIGVEYNTLQEYRRISAAFEKSRRLDNLSWTHHQVAAAWSNPSQWLNDAVKYRWSVAAMREEYETAEQAKHVLREAEGAVERAAAARVQGEAEEKGLPAPVTNPVADEFVLRVSEDFPAVVDERGESIESEEVTEVGSVRYQDAHPAREPTQREQEIEITRNWRGCHRELRQAYWTVKGLIDRSSKVHSDNEKAKMLDVARDLITVLSELTDSLGGTTGGAVLEGSSRSPGEPKP